MNRLQSGSSPLLDTAVGRVLPTRFGGRLFRSRTEARWAVFFHTLGVRWEYEPEGYALDSGAYLPDFYIPAWDSFFEVKSWAEISRFEKHCKRALQLRRAANVAGSYVIFGAPELLQCSAIFDWDGVYIATHIGENGPIRGAPVIDGPAYIAYRMAMEERFEAKRQ